MGYYEQQIVKDLLNGRVVAYQPKLAPLFGVYGALLLSQLLYWKDKGARKDGWFYKTQAEIQEELWLTRTQQETAIKKLKQSGVISVKLRGIPAKRHFYVHMRKLQSCLQDFYNLESDKSDNHKVGKRRTITKTTQESTQDTTTPQRVKNTGSYEPVGDTAKIEEVENEPIDLSAIPF